MIRRIVKLGLYIHSWFWKDQTKVSRRNSDYSAARNERMTVTVTGLIRLRYDDPPRGVKSEGVEGVMGPAFCCPNWMPGSGNHSPGRMIIKYVTFILFPMFLGVKESLSWSKSEDQNFGLKSP